MGPRLRAEPLEVFEDELRHGSRPSVPDPVPGEQGPRCLEPRCEVRLCPAAPRCSRAAARPRPGMCPRTVGLDATGGRSALVQPRASLFEGRQAWARGRGLRARRGSTQRPASLTGWILSDPRHREAAVAFDVHRNGDPRSRPPSANAGARCRPRVGRLVRSEGDGRGPIGVG
jgi:hypothetical protein